MYSGGFGESTAQDLGSLLVSFFHSDENRAADDLDPRSLEPGGCMLAGRQSDLTADDPPGKTWKSVAPAAIISHLPDFYRFLGPPDHTGYRTSEEIPSSHSQGFHCFYKKEGMMPVRYSTYRHSQENSNRKKMQEWDTHLTKSREFKGLWWLMPHSQQSLRLVQRQSGRDVFSAETSKFFQCAFVAPLPKSHTGQHRESTHCNPQLKLELR